MLHQTLDLADLPRLLTLAFVELSLSADNAIVLGLLAHSLMPDLRKRALLIGSISAFFFRAFALLGVNFLLSHFWMQLAGGAYLVYLSFRSVRSRRKNGRSIKLQNLSFWKIVLLVELFDLAFAADSILAGMAFIASSQIPGQLNPKLWIVYFGGMLGLLGIRYAAHWFSEIIDKFPRLEKSAYLLVGWIGLKLIYEGLAHFLKTEVRYEPLFWVVSASILLFGFTSRLRKT